MSGINVEARKELRKLINRLLRNKTVGVIVSNKLDRTFLNGEAAVVSYGQKITIETFENPPKLVGFEAVQPINVWLTVSQNYNSG